MGYTPGLQHLPEIGQHIHYGGNAYYVLNELQKRGFIVTRHDDRK
jgi:DNA-binding PadR family transcriptional regulator